MKASNRDDNSDGDGDGDDDNTDGENHPKRARKSEVLEVGLVVTPP